MDLNIRLVVHNRKFIYDDLIVTLENVIHHENNMNNEILLTINTNNNNETCQRIIIPICMNKRGFNAYLASAYVYLLKNSHVYRKFAKQALNILSLNRVKNNRGIFRVNFVIFLRLRMPKKQFLDYKWNRIMTTLALEKKEINYAMSWLSTLGGAFSAMGDHFDHCADVAGKISIQQFKLALRLNDPLLVSRCKLYACLSLIQRKKFKFAKREIPELHKFAIENKDYQLKRMCEGVWAKFKYCYYQHKQFNYKKLKDYKI